MTEVRLTYIPQDFRAFQDLLRPGQEAALTKPRSRLWRGAVSAFALLAFLILLSEIGLDEWFLHFAAGLFVLLGVIALCIWIWIRFIIPRRVKADMAAMQGGVLQFGESGIALGQPPINANKFVWFHYSAKLAAGKIPRGRWIVVPSRIFPDPDAYEVFIRIALRMKGNMAE
jgi:hypothetical protein